VEKKEMIRSNGEQPGESVESALKKKREGYDGKDLWKGKVLSVERGSSDEIPPRSSRDGNAQLTKHCSDFCHSTAL